MAAIRNEMQWLGKLKASQLHQLAIALGSACSGSKVTVAGGIRQTLTSVPSDTSKTYCSSASIPTGSSRQLSIVSIDMGIQNLAYAHLLATHSNDRSSEITKGAGLRKQPVLNAWERLNAFPVETSHNPISKPLNPGQYDPSRYASAAYHFITDILTKHDPTYVLIEQQRFRSGGSSAVAEWTIRVGVFEGMLHAILRTMREERKDRSKLQAVVSINPARTARFWLEGSGRADNLLEPTKISGREGKQAKIDIVGKSFSDARNRLVESGSTRAKAMEIAFMQKWYTTSKVAKELGLHRTIPCEIESGLTKPKQPKLDDLADCLLQALAWLRWQQAGELLLQDSNSEDPLAAVRQRLKELA